MLFLVYHNSIMSVKTFLMFNFKPMIFNSVHLFKAIFYSLGSVFTKHKVMSHLIWFFIHNCLWWEFIPEVPHSQL